MQPNGQLYVNGAEDILYNDIPPNLAKIATGLLLPQSEQSLRSKAIPPAWALKYYDNRRAYVNTLLDKALLPDVQETLLRGTGVKWEVQPFFTGHSPFLSQPRALSAYIHSMVLKFRGLDSDLDGSSNLTAYWNFTNDPVSEANLTTTNNLTIPLNLTELDGLTTETNLTSGLNQSNPAEIVLNATPSLNLTAPANSTELVDPEGVGSALINKSALLELTTDGSGTQLTSDLDPSVGTS